MQRNARARLAGLLALGVAFALSAARDVTAQGLILTGYGDLEWRAIDNGGEGWKNSFNNHHFNLIALGSITEDLIVGGEVEFEDSGAEIGLEYAYIGYTGIKNLRLMAGKFIIPFNRWNKDLHPTWINKLPGKPLVYESVFPTTYNDTGLWASAALPVGTGSRATLDAYVVNGLEGSADEADFVSLVGANPEELVNVNNKAVGGRLGLELAQGLGLGFSGYTGAYADDEATGSGLQISFFGADADYHNEGLELRAEFVAASQEITTGDNNNRKGFYGQAAYEIDKFEPVLRYSWVDFEGDNDPGDTSELGFGLSYYVGSSSALRLAYFINTERHDEFKTDNNKVIGQFVVAF